MPLTRKTVDPQSHGRPSLRRSILLRRILRHLTLIDRLLADLTPLALRGSLQVPEYYRRPLRRLTYVASTIAGIPDDRDLAATGDLRAVIGDLWTLQTALLKAAEV